MILTECIQQWIWAMTFHTNTIRLTSYIRLVKINVKTKNIRKVMKINLGLFENKKNQHILQMFHKLQDRNNLSKVSFYLFHEMKLSSDCTELSILYERF